MIVCGEDNIQNQNVRNSPKPKFEESEMEYKAKKGNITETKEVKQFFSRSNKDAEFQFILEVSDYLVLFSKRHWWFRNAPLMLFLA